MTCLRVVTAGDVRENSLKDKERENQKERERKKKMCIWHNELSFCNESERQKERQKEKERMRKKETKGERRNVCCIVTRLLAIKRKSV